MTHLGAHVVVKQRVGLWRVQKRQELCRKWFEMAQELEFVPVGW